MRRTSTSPFGFSSPGGSNVRRRWTRTRTRPDVEVMEERKLLAVVVVNTTSDAPVTRLTTLRHAIQFANAQPAGTLTTIQFNIASSGLQTITPLSPLPAITNPVILDGTTEPGFDPSNPVPIIAIDGSTVRASTTPGFSTADGLDVYGGNSTILGLAIDNFGGNGIRLGVNGNDDIQLNYLGIAPDGATGAGNGLDGLLIDDIPNVSVGIPALTSRTSTPTAFRNVISANGLNGIEVDGMGESGFQDVTVLNTHIEGNFIGTDASGNNPLGNQANGVALFSGASDNTITNNTISGNLGSGIVLWCFTFNNTITFNDIGVGYDGVTPLGNRYSGIDANMFAMSNTVGLNILSANGLDGVTLHGGSDSNVFRGNQIGTILGGTKALGNHGNGVTIENSILNQVGGPPVKGNPQISGPNVISGNGGYGVEIVGLPTPHPGFNAPEQGNNLVQSNRIGTDLAGESALPNGVDGVAIASDSSATVGGSSAEGNLISGNRSAGIKVTIRLSSGGTAPSTNSNSIVISGNTIGTNLEGTTLLKNAPSTGTGIVVTQTSNVTIGGADLSDRNLISGNPQGGVRIEGPGASGIVLQNNFTGTDVTGTLAIGNGTIEPGVFVNNIGSSDSSSPGASIVANVISGNAAGDLELSGKNATHDQVVNNKIGVDASGNQVVAVGAGSTSPATFPFGILLSGTSFTGITGNIIALGVGGGTGVVVDRGPAGAGGLGTGNTIQGNTIGTNTLDTPLGNDVGIYLNNVAGNTVGGNTISTNQVAGVYLFGNAAIATQNVISGNRIGGPTGTKVKGFDPFQPDAFRVSGTLGNGVGVYVEGASGNTISSNGIFGNFQAGVYEFDRATNTVVNNQIENNGGYGVILFNTLRNPDPSLANTLQGNNAANFRTLFGPSPFNNRSAGGAIPSVAAASARVSHPTAHHGHPRIVRARRSH